MRISNATRTLLIAVASAAACLAAACSEPVPVTSDAGVSGDAAADGGLGAPLDLAARPCKATISPSDGLAPETWNCFASVSTDFSIRAPIGGVKDALRSLHYRLDSSRFTAGTYGPRDISCTLYATTSTARFGWAASECPADTKLVLEWVAPPTSGRGTFDVTVPSMPPRTDTAKVHVEF